MDNKDRVNTVRRITVDERLSEELIRLVICELKSDSPHSEINDNPDSWRNMAKEVIEIIARPANSEGESAEDNYTNLMSIPKSLVEKFQWKDFKEGQVFLSGAFEVNNEKTDGKKRYFVSPGKNAFEQIDDNVKENTKTLYYEILAKGEKNG